MEMDLQSAVNQIQTSKDPVGKLGELILASGCFWSSTEATDPSKIFNIQLYGVHGMGIGAAAALTTQKSHETKSQECCLLL